MSTESNQPIENLDWKKLGQTRKLWSVIIMLWAFAPIGLIWMALRPTYYRKDGKILRVSKLSKILIAIPFSILTLYGLAVLFVPGANLSCDDTEVTKTVHKIFSQNEHFIKAKAELKAITNIEETGYDASKDIHLCHANILYRVGDKSENDEINYTVKVTKGFGNKIEFLVEVN